MIGNADAGFLLERLDDFAQKRISKSGVTRDDVHDGQHVSNLDAVKDALDAICKQFLLFLRHLSDHLKVDVLAARQSDKHKSNLERFIMLRLHSL